jgi:ABC-type glycerol-3-phosphate transport system substrate-binding protein
MPVIMGEEWKPHESKEKVNAVARRKSAFLFLLFVLMVLILSPWAAAPVPQVPADPVEPQSAASAAPPPVIKESVRLSAALAMGEEEFAAVQRLNEEMSFRYPDVTVELERIPSEEAFEVFRKASQLGDVWDVMLLENEWVKSFAASGYLMPADGAFEGEALSEQFDAIAAPLKWNGYIWAVPRDIDPYVVVWNRGVVGKILGSEAAEAPQNTEEWALLAAKSQEGEQAGGWLAIDRREPQALLAWLQTVSGHPTDKLWDKGVSAWNGTPAGAALTLLDKHRAGVLLEPGVWEIEHQLSAGRTAAAVLPYSAARKWEVAHSDAGKGLMSIDMSAWKQASVWPRGRSFAISSRTEEEDAARRWIAAMTGPSVQQENLAVFGKLPVYRSLYRNGSLPAGFFPETASSSFPYRAQAEYGPELPLRLSRLGALWTEWGAGTGGMEEWVRRWPETSADFELND